MRILQTLAATTLLAMIGVARATEAVDPEDLAKRIEAGTRAIWPDMTVDVTIDGCAYRQIKDFEVQDERTEDIVQVDLGNIATDPDKIFRDGQLMGDGSGRTWWTYNIVYYWNRAFLNRNAKDITRLDRAHTNLDDRFNEETSVNLTDAEFSAIEEKFSDAAEAMFRDFQNGAYGNALKANYRVSTTWPKDKRTFYFYRFRDTNLPNSSYLDFVLNDDVADQILADLHAYVQANCRD